MCCPMIGSGYTLIVLACLACGLSFVAPFWLLVPDVSAPGIFSAGNLESWILDPNSWSEGLFATCYKAKNEEIAQARCTWFWQNDFKWEKGRPDWHKASQGLFAAGLILLIIGWLIGTFHVCCCHCCKESSVGSALGSLTLSGLILITASLTVYGVFSARDRNAGFDQNYLVFYWGYFAGVAGVLFALIAVILFFCDGCRTREHSGYHMTRVV